MFSLCATLIVVLNSWVSAVGENDSGRVLQRALWRLRLGCRAVQQREPARGRHHGKCVACAGEGDARGCMLALCLLLAFAVVLPCTFSGLSVVCLPAIASCTSVLSTNIDIPARTAGCRGWCCGHAARREGAHRCGRDCGRGKGMGACLRWILARSLHAKGPLASMNRRVLCVGFGVALQNGREPS